MEPESDLEAIFTPDLELEWELGPGVEIIFSPEEA